MPKTVNGRTKVFSTKEFDVFEGDVSYEISFKEHITPEKIGKKLRIPKYNFKKFCLSAKNQSGFATSMAEYIEQECSVKLRDYQIDNRIFSFVVDEKDPVFVKNPFVRILEEPACVENDDKPISRALLAEKLDIDRRCISVIKTSTEVIYCINLVQLFGGWK